MYFSSKYFTSSATKGTPWNMTCRICLFYVASILSPSNAFAGGNALTEYVVSQLSRISCVSCANHDSCMQPWIVIWLTFLVTFCHASGLSNFLQNSCAVLGHVGRYPIIFMVIKSWRKYHEVPNRVQFDSIHLMLTYLFISAGEAFTIDISFTHWCKHYFITIRWFIYIWCLI